MTLHRPTHSIRATVLGAGTMGAQIAAHLANAGARVHLLDIVPPGTAADAPKAARNAVAAGALKAMLKGKPAPFMDPAAAERIRVGNLEDDLERAVAGSDLVLEAVIERLDIKQPLFARIAAAAPAHAVLATNTSGLPIRSIAAALPESARRRVVGMHFFNPPRYMHLLEVVPGPDTDPAVVAELTWFSETVLGKGVVPCRDTPNFIANRIGVAATILTFRTTFEGGYTVEEVDLLNGPLLGRPRTGSFRLGDLVGLDVSALVTENLRKVTSSDPASPDYDELHDAMVSPQVLQQMLAKGLRGDKVGQGFYKKVKGERGSDVLSIDFATLEYRARIEPQFPELADVAKLPDLAQRAAAALRAPGRAGDFLRKVYLPLFAYAANRLGSICDDPKPVDDAMCWGYGWKVGPFALWDMIGVAWSLQQLQAMGHPLPKAAVALVERHGENARWYGGTAAAPTVWVPAAGEHRPIPAQPGVLLLSARREAQAGSKGEIHRTKSASLIDLGDGIACVEFRSKMNTLDEGVLTMLREAIPALERTGGFRGLVIGSQDENFSAGADARQILALATAGKWDELAAAVALFQDTLMGLRHGPIPVVAAPYGMTLGGGAETTLSCAAVVAHAELYMGLVEAGIGVVPAGGGLKELARRASAWASEVDDGDPYPMVRRAFENAAGAKVSSSAHEARRMGMLAAGDRIAFHRLQVLAQAKRQAIALAEGGWTPPDRDEPIVVVGTGRGASFQLGAQLFEWGGYASAHDKLVAQKIGHVLAGGDRLAGTKVVAKDLLELEREAFVSLCGEEKTRARIEHTLKTGKPLRN
ncbi:MAG: 3-hydroxyacyl-CoA dehydrogenase/enoyl-CoA hydratase family protein [Nannocystaceae bacterium]|nr:3-hydroxyacyl-CoA dehydrogenase/enoyl-CoA hydratase family protein [Nannocystaceae bacterium]